MALTDRDLQQVGAYVRAHLVEWLPVPVLELGERIVRVEEELKAQREIMIRGFEQVDKRFEQVDKRFEQVDKRFEQVDKRFEQVDKRFEQIDKRLDQVDRRLEQVDRRFEHQETRFGQIDKRFEELDARFERRFRGQTWLIGTGFVLLSLLMSLYTFFA